MSSNITNRSPYLRNSRDFPEDPKKLSIELGRAYLDQTQAINDRTIGLYPTNTQAITGNNYYLQGNQKQQSLRQVFTFTSTASINHGINVPLPGQFLPTTSGSYTDGTDSFGLLFGTSVAIAGLISFYVTATQIVFVTGGGAPVLSSGIILLEWVSQV